ncbi:MAG: DUF6326 family protein [Rubrobacteraceae bacterium]
MSTDEKTTGIETKALLSTLWIFMLLNMLFRDFHELLRPGTIEEMTAGVVNGTPMTEELVLLGGIMLEIPILMVLLCRILNYRVNRWANIILAPVTAAMILQNGVRDLDDIFFVTIEVAALAVIVWVAWRWRKPELGSKQTNLTS